MEANVVFEKRQPNDITINELKNASVGQYNKIILKEYLEYILPEDVLKEIICIKDKLKIGDIIQIQGYDLYELSYSIVNDTMSTIDYNNLIKDRKQILCVTDLKYLLKHLKFKILSVDVDGYQYLIEAQNEE